MTEPTDQRELFRAAVKLLGGNTITAREIDVSERTITRLLTGHYSLHDGFLRDISAALLRRADECRALEKQLCPLFTENLAPDQRREDKRRTRHLTDYPGGE